MIRYKSYIIEPETDPWALKSNWLYRFYIDGERIYSASSVEEAIELIDQKEP